MPQNAAQLVTKRQRAYRPARRPTMFKSISKLFRPHPAKPLPNLPAGQRVYAIGDIHGRRDLFDRLIAAIEADEAGRVPAETTIILLGDLVDRGPDSAGVIAAARALAARRAVRILCGNHEEMFLRSFDEIDILRHFLRFGGRETILSYPLDVTQWNAATLELGQAMMRQIVPESDLEFIRTFEDWIVIGDYCFVHAGIAPGVPMADQKPGDLRWIREPFLSHVGDHGFVVVHGHTIADEPEIRRNRIGIDTGAYASGKLTALALEGESRWLLTADLTEDAAAPASHRA
jgi:serine/threonine protein phosphatase 1